MPKSRHSHPILQSLLILFFLIPILSADALAANIGTVPNWYADEPGVYYIANFNSNGYLYYQVVYAAGSLTEQQAVVSAATYAENLWDNNLSEISLAKSSANASIDVMCGHYSELVGEFPVLSGHSSDEGWTWPPDPLTTHSVTYGGSRYAVMEIDVTVERNTRIFLMVDYSETIWLKNIVAHEMGHALAWYGHNTSSNRTVMSDAYADYLELDKTSLRTLYTSDVNHINQIYSLVR